LPQAKKGENMKKIMLVMLVLTALFGIAACVEGEDKIIVQGVTDTEIVVGNTAATSGAFSVVGIPFNAGIEAYFRQINEDEGGIAGRTLRFVTYDDGFDQATGISYTKKLVEEDQVFALVGHFGTPTVSGTLEYIEDIGVPMVYAATGINALYFQESPANPIMAVQPIYKTDGRVMTARALYESLYGETGDQPLAADAKIGVLHTTDDAGMSIKEGVEAEAEFAGKTADFIFKSFSGEDVAALTTAIIDLQTEGVQAVIIAANQAPYKVAVGTMNTQGLHVPTFTSYVSANANAVEATTDYEFDLYANAWIDIVDPEGLYGFSQAYWDFAATMTAAGYDGNTEGKANFTADAYAMAGYIAASIFVEGLKRVGEDELTWESYIQAMESAPITVPMGGFVDFAGGKRWGIASMALLKLTPVMDAEDPETRVGWNWAKVREIEGIEDIEAK
jgi:branched-chain amino acid transport system substrate-binding protein